ncbi:MAG: hypothetical protein J3K34DRAFT_419152 [Monoraphidium minutum]|nr:MAG: hypothetical protein J3K34DRAFT_419152 [Monoraphidium minutum]
MLSWDPAHRCPLQPPAGAHRARAPICALDRRRLACRACARRAAHTRAPPAGAPPPHTPARPRGRLAASQPHALVWPRVSSHPTLFKLALPPFGRLGGPALRVAATPFWLLHNGAPTPRANGCAAGPQMRPLRAPARPFRARAAAHSRARPLCTACGPRCLPSRLAAGAPPAQPFACVLMCPHPTSFAPVCRRPTKARGVLP